MTTAIILAGGMGTRLRTVVPDLPKPMAPINGRAFIEYQMDYWIGQGVDRFVVSVGYKREVIMSHLGPTYRSTPLSYAIEEEPLGTGGGMLLAAQGLDEPFLVLNGDTFFEVDLALLRDFHADQFADCTLSLCRVSDGSRYMGVSVRSNGEIESLKSESEKVGRLVNGGVYLVSPSVLRRMGLVPGLSFSLEDDLLPAMQVGGCKLSGLEFPGAFIDIGVPEDYFHAANIILNC